MAFQEKNAQALQLLGETYFRQGKDSAAVKELERAIQQQPSDPVSHFLKAEALFVMKQYSKAEAEYIEVTKLDPTGPLGQAARKRLDSIKH
jgi:Tfp pilus assembly protein PilF